MAKVFVVQLSFTLTRQLNTLFYTRFSLKAFKFKTHNQCVSNKMECVVSRLPEECIAEIVSFTSASDASRSSTVSKEFKSAAENELVWERFLPLDYQEIISTAVYPLKFATKKQLYIRLSDSPVIIHGAKMVTFTFYFKGYFCFYQLCKLWKFSTYKSLYFGVFLSYTDILHAQ